MFETKFLPLADTELAYRLIEVPNSKTDGACLMLHGAGVAGELTYAPMLDYLDHWRWILIPDLTGMGQSFFHGQQEAPLSIDQLSAEIEQLLQHLSWQAFDIIGYSLGGLVALHLNAQRQSKQGKAHRLALMEPASLERECVETLAEVRQRYRVASQTIRETGDVELGIAHFMDGVAPNRRKHPVAEATTQSRLAHRPLGFSYALDAVTDWVERVSGNVALRDDMLAQADQVFLLSGELSHALLRQHYDELAEQHLGWQHQTVKGCDHSLPFQKPRQIAKYLSAWFA
ncbi:Putative aminoacrylate hydrolase RutD [Marinomonas aquimarina]|uniref:Putative aminoacrylate hydrolase RutD n=1 Tax=Marinomonas aquimarina TaxID=295068 RepID=A0A1A8T5Y2_9GAMM|nr:alpha/beta hydrolase [Marinomonas aquimarina]SBS26434.1 Putative aminoacrylate hydrolase RutD [Marinomonas aquimarina]